MTELRTRIAPAPLLSIVVPVYRSEGCLSELIAAIIEALRPFSWAYEVILVNDFSPDGSWQVIESLCLKHEQVTGVDLRRNFGQDNAILTGMRLSHGKYVAVMDDDLQHHPKYLPALLERASQGADVVFADFETKHHKLWKNAGSWVNGKLAEWLLYKPRNVYLSPYKVVVREVVDLICQYPGPTPYIDGLLLQATWRLASVPVEHMPRHAGRSNYNFLRSLGVSARLIFSFSVKPARLITWFGLATAVAGLSAAVLVVGYRILYPQAFTQNAVGWASLMVTLLVVSGLQMIFFGILGEYAGRTYLSLNGKPQTAVREVLNAHGSREPGENLCQRASYTGNL